MISLMATSRTENASQMYGKCLFKVIDVQFGCISNEEIIDTGIDRHLNSENILSIYRRNDTFLSVLCRKIPEDSQITKYFYDNP